MGLQTCCPITVPVWVSAPKSQSLQSLRQQSKGSNCSVRDCFDYQVASSANDADLFLDANDALTWPDGSAGMPSYTFNLLTDLYG